MNTENKLPLMKQIQEPARTIPVMAETDVLIVGSGPSGLAAALAAAREGVSTMLVERYGSFGGNITQAHVASIAWYRYEQTVEAGGIGVEFEKRAVEMGAAQKSDLLEYLDADTRSYAIEKLASLPNPMPSSPTLDADMFKYVADKMVQEAGIIPVLHCFVVNVIMEGDTIKGIITESKSGRQAILAKRVIDATGDADIAYHAGAPYYKAPKDELMEVSMNFGCSGVDIGKFLGHSAQKLSFIRDWAKETSGKEDGEISSYMVEPFNQATEAGEIPKDVKIASLWTTVTPFGEVKNLNAIDIPGIDATDVWDLTKAEIEGRQRAIWALNALRKYKPGFENAVLRTFGSTVGVRETRRIVGAYNITGHDVRNEARFNDSIGIFPEFLDAYGIVILPTTGRYFQVPYGICLPQKVENLLVVGRSVGGDKISHAATRQTMCCAVTGQGAGVAAAISLKNNVTCREIDVRQVQKALEKQNVRIK
jgi:choline dehydrogenase-like flavoprotein